MKIKMKLMNAGSWRHAILYPLLFLGINGAIPRAAAAEAKPFAPAVPAHLRGTNIPIQGAVPDLAKEVAGWGGNCIRVNVSVDKDFPKDGQAPAGDPLQPYKGGMALLRAFLPVCHQLGIGVIICADGIPGRKLDVFWKNSDMTASSRGNLVAFWKAFAREFKGDPAIIAYDVFNEPNFPDGKGTLWTEQMLPPAVAAIRAVNPDIWLVVEPGPWGLAGGFAHLHPLDDPRVIYSFHEYAPHNYTHQGVGKRADSKGKLTYPGILQDFDTDAPKPWSKETLLAYMQPAIDFMHKYKVRIIVGEFGVARWAPGREKWVQDNIDIFEQQGWDWLYHSLAGWNGWNPTYAPDAPPAQTTGNGGVMSPTLKVMIKGWQANSPLVPAK